MINKLLIFICWASIAWAGAEAPNTKDFDSWQENRIKLQSKFSVLQAKLLKAGDKIIDEDQREALSFLTSLSQFKKDFYSYEEKRYNFWNSESYWSPKNWTKGDCMKQTVDKLRVNLDDINTSQISASPPFSKADINSAQKLLNTVRNCLDLDKELQQKSKVLIK